MLKKFLGLTLLGLTVAVYCFSLPFFSEKTITCVGGKSSGSFINQMVFCDNDGYSVTLSKEKALKFIKSLNCKEVYFEDISGIKNYYLYTDKLLKKQLVKGKMVNIHLAINGDIATIGYPFIYASY